MRRPAVPPRRFIDAAIPDLTPDQRRRLKEQSRQGTEDKKRRAAGDAGGQGSGKKQGGASAKDQAISFLQEVLQEGTTQGKPQ